MFEIKVSRRGLAACPCMRHFASALKAFASSRGVTRRTLIYGIISTILLATPVIAAESNFSVVRNFSGPYVVTIKGVYLKDDAGQWVKVIEPDHRVDLSKEEAVVTFFNNRGRVPTGNYKNFRIEFLGEGAAGVQKIYSAADFKKSVFVKKGSFIHVSFDLRLNKKIEIQKVDVTVDEDNREFLTRSLILEV